MTKPNAGLGSKPANAQHSERRRPRARRARDARPPTMRDAVRAEVADAHPGQGAWPATASRDSAIDAVRKKAAALFDFCLEHPDDLDLIERAHGAHLRAMALQPTRQLNARLREALAPAQQGLRELGLDARDAQTEATALFAHIAGLLMLSHAGPIRMFRHESQRLFEGYLEALVARASPQPIGPSRRRAVSKRAP